MTDETKRRSLLLDAYVRLDLSVNIYRVSAPVRDERRARAICLASLVDDLADAGAQRLVLESREGRDHQDRAVIHSTLQRAGHGLAYEHLLPREEPLLWVADGFAWAHGAGGVWRQRIASRVHHLRDLDVD